MGASIVAELANCELGSVKVMFSYADDVGLHFIGEAADGGKFASTLVQAEAVCILAVDAESVGGFSGQFVAPKSVG
jgi:hypothetical protein